MSTSPTPEPAGTSAGAPTDVPADIPASVPTPADASVKAAAATLVDGTTVEEFKAGTKEIQKIPIALGICAARFFFKQLIELSELPTAEKIAARKKVREFAAFKDSDHAMRLDFVKEGRKRTLYLKCGACAKDHDLGAQLARIDPYIKDEEKKKLRMHMSMLILCGRSIYCKMIQDNGELYEKIIGNLPQDTKKLVQEQKIDLRTLAVDPSNTTLYIFDFTPKRVGLFFVDDPKSEQS
jgi:hypothetical protein